MRSSLLCLAAVLLLSPDLFGQHHDHSAPCGTSREDLDQITEQLVQNLAVLEERPVDLRNGAITYVPIKFHIVRKSDGTEGVDTEFVLAMLCGLNEFFADQEIQFFIKGGFNYINNSVLFDNPKGTTGVTVMNNNRASGHLNIFLTNQTGEADVLGYYTAGQSYAQDYIVIRKSEIGYKKYTLEHEVGHYFGILHPFNGWECDPWDAVKHGNPLNLTTAPCITIKPPFTNYPLVEFADGSNSTTAGDLVSDTPADYNLGLGWSNCNYNGGARDKNGILLNPDEKNIMGYFLNCAPYTYSPIQKQLIATDLTNRKNAVSSSNRKLNTAAIPILEPNSPVVALSPVDEGYSNGTVDIKLEWAAGAGARNYIVRIDRFASFSFQPRYYFTDQPEVILDFVLGSSGKYYWQVYAWNDYNTCPVWGEVFSFTVGSPSAISALPGLDNLVIMPQPLGAGQPLQMQLAATRPLELDLEIYHVNGHLVYRQARLQVPAGEHALSPGWIPAHPGMYVVRLSANGGQYTGRVVVH